MNKTKIEWVKNPDGTPGYTWNPITGCLNCTPDGLCRGGMFPCYAYRLANGRLRSRYLANQNRAYRDDKLYREQVSNPFYPRFWEDRLNEPYAGKTAMGKPKGIFTCDMSDLFGVGVPGEWTRRVLKICKMSSPHRFYLLTKQSQNLINFSPFPDNCWVGVTATDKTMFGRATDALMYVQAKVKYISFEPLLASSRFYPERLRYVGINWVIIGSQTKPAKFPEISWVEEIVRVCDKAGVKVFLKDNLKPLIDEHCPDESNLQPNHDSLLRMKHPFLCKDCDGEECYKCGVIWGLRQEMPTTNV